MERLIGRGEAEPVGDVEEARLRVHVDGAVIRHGPAPAFSGPGSEHPADALARVLTGWQAHQLSDYAHMRAAAMGARRTPATYPEGGLVGLGGGGWVPLN